MGLLKLKKEQKKLFADKLIDLSHLIFATMVVGQLISGKDFSYLLAITGILLVGLLYFISYTLTK